MRRWILSAASVTALMLSGCMKFSPNYEFDAPPQRNNPCHNLRVAVTPTFQHWDAAWNYDFIINRDSCAAIITKHLAHEKIFNYQKAVGDLGEDRTKAITQLRNKSYDAILTSDIMVLARRQNSSLTSFNAVFPFPIPALFVIDAADPRSSAAACKVDFKLISTSDGKVIWKGEEIGSATGTGNVYVDKPLNEAFKKAFTGLIHQMETAHFDKH
jgi:hypothetical protein